MAGSAARLQHSIRSLSARLTTVDSASARPCAVISPYRICPLGAHVDHQGGKVLGTAIDRYTVLLFQPHDTTQVHLISNNFDTPASFSFEEAEAHRVSDWSRYAAGAVWALNREAPLSRGISGGVSGELLGSGVSSSASVGLAYLKALADVNGIMLDNETLIQLARSIENDYLNLQSGLLDPAVIAYSRPDALTHMDTRTHELTYIEHPSNIDNACWVIIYSGFSRELTATGFNDRVAECMEAARLMDSHANILSDVSVTHYTEKKSAITRTFSPPCGALLYRASAN